MTAAELIKLLSALPPETKVELFTSQSEEELGLDLIEYYELPRGPWVMLMDRGCEQGPNSRLLWDRRSEYEG